MYRVVMPVVIVLLLLAGCKSGSSSSNKPGTSAADGVPGSKSGGQGTVTPTAKDEGPKLTAKYEGQTADVWSKQLMDEESKAVSDNAAAALKAIGPESVPYLVKAMHSKTEWVKLNAMWVMEEGKDWAKNYGKDLAPALNKALLDDDKSKVRRQAAAVIAVLQFPESVEALRKAVNLEQDPGVKRKLEEYLKQINK